VCVCVQCIGAMDFAPLLQQFADKSKVVDKRVRRVYNIITHIASGRVGRGGRGVLCRDPLRCHGGEVRWGEVFSFRTPSPPPSRYGNRPGSLINLRCLRRQMCQIGVPPLQSAPMCIHIIY